MSSKPKNLQLVEVSTRDGALLVPYEIRRSRRARHIRLSVGRQNHALLSVPWGCAYAEALEFLRTQGDWLARQIGEQSGKRSLAEFLERQPRLYGLGRTFRLSLGLAKAKPFYVYSTETQEVELRLPVSDDRELALTQMVRAFAQEVVPPRVMELAAAVSVPVKRVSVRDQATRWGSCSTSGTISLNWRLVLLRPDLQDHVIWHELAHVREMNHSPRFWELLQRYDPKTREHNAQLNPAAARLMPLGRV